MTTKILNNYKHASDKDLLTLLHMIIGKMDGNPNFADPPAALEMLKTELPEFISALTNAAGRDSEMAAIKNAKKAEIISLLTNLVNYVTAKGQQDRAILLSSGFPVSGERGQTKMGEIKELKLELGHPGELTSKVKAVTGAKAYIHLCTIAPVTDSSVWIQNFVLAPTFKYTGLQSMQRYIFQVIALGRDDQRVISPQGVRVIQ